MINRAVQLLLIPLLLTCGQTTSNTVVSNDAEYSETQPTPKKNETVQLKEQQIPKDQIKKIHLEPYDLTNFPLNWVRLTENDSSTIIYNSCDGGNMLIRINPLDSTILFHGQQEDMKYEFKRFGITEESVIHFIINEFKQNRKFTFKWTSTNPELGFWDLTFYYYGDDPQNALFVSNSDQLKFKTVDQPCRECWDDEFCDEIESRPK